MKDGVVEVKSTPLVMRSSLSLISSGCVSTEPVAMRVLMYWISSQYSAVVAVPGKPVVNCWVPCDVGAPVPGDPVVPGDEAWVGADDPVVVPTVGPDDPGVPWVIDEELGVPLDISDVVVATDCDD
jgi:hypothetical protein